MQIENLNQLFPDLEEGLYNELLEYGNQRYVAAGDTLLKVGQNIRYTMLILDGIIKLYREDENGKEFFIYNLAPGQACSLSMVCAARQETSEILAIALTDATLLAVPLECMEQWMGKYKSLYQFVITTYRNRFEELLKTIDAIAFTSLDERLELYPFNQSKQVGNILKITHQGIANDLNSSREVISRLLKKMESKGWLTIHRSAIEWIKNN